MNPKRLVNISASCDARKIVYINYEQLQDEKFVALSHVWSKCNNDLDHKGVTWEVRAFSKDNALLFLEIARLYFVNLCNAIWIDAYCIDQSNEQEKGQEIIHMGDYYSMAIKVVVMPNGIDGIYDNSMVFNLYDGHWCKWTQRVWTAPEVSLAQSSVVMCCMSKYQVERIISIRSIDLNKQLFPLNILATYDTPTNSKLMILDIQIYCDIVTLKASGYLDGNSDTNDGDFDYPKGIERTMRTISNLREKNNITHWIHRTAIRSCEKDADRIYSMLPKCNYVDTINFVETNDTLDDAIGNILEKVDAHTISYMVLSTMPNYDKRILPLLKLSNASDASLVHIDSDILLSSDLSMTYVKQTGLVLKSVKIALNVTIEKYVHLEREGFNDADEVFGNNAYSLSNINRPCCVGKCNSASNANLLQIGSIGLNVGDRFRMIEFYEDQNTENVRLACCIACNELMQKIGVLMVDEHIFKQLNQGYVTDSVVT